jgi:hypothetical protein
VQLKATFGPGVGLPLEEGKYSDCIIWHSRVIVEDKVYGRTVCALAIDA